MDDPYVFARLRCRFADQISQCPRTVFDEGLLQQANLRRRPVVILGPVVFAEVYGRHGRDLHGNVVRQCSEFLGARYEVRLAPQLHQRADAPAGVDIRLDRKSVV